MKKVLVVTTRPLESNVSSSIRKISTINALVSEGAEVTVLTTSIQKNSINFTNKVNLDVKKTIRIDIGIIYELGIQSPKNSRSLRFIKNQLRKVYYGFRIYDHLKKSINNIYQKKDELESFYDIIISISDPKSSHLLANELIKNKMVNYNKYIQIWGDPMYLDITNKSHIPKPFIKKEEENLLKLPNKVYYVSPLTLEEEKKLFPKFAYKMDVLIPLSSDKVVYEEVNKVKKLGYFGDYNSKIRDLKPLYNAIKGSEFELIVYGNSDMQLDPTSNIMIRGRIPFEQLKQSERDVDMLVHLSNSSGTQIPGKIYHYIRTNKPILFILDGNSEKIASFFGELNRVVFTKNDEKEIIKQIKLFNKRIIQPSNVPIDTYNSKYYKERLMEL